MEEWYSAAMKTISATGGGILALIFKPPHTLKQGWQRLAFSVGCGVAFGDTIRTEYLHWSDNNPNVYASFVAVAFVSWFVAPLVLKLGEVIMTKVRAK